MHLYEINRAIIAGTTHTQTVIFLAVLLSIKISSHYSNTQVGSHSSQCTYPLSDAVPEITGKNITNSAKEAHKSTAPFRIGFFIRIRHAHIIGQKSVMQAKYW